MAAKEKFEKTYDIVVVGLGTAGAMALITAAKYGMRALGIEYLDAMGGTGTLGGIGTYYFGSRGGLYEQINSMAAAEQKKYYIDVTSSGCDVKSYVLEKTAKEYGAEILYESVVTQVFKDGSQAIGLTYLCRGKQTDIGCRAIIDCTGDADICRMAGAEVSIGRAFDGLTQPFSNIVIAVKDNSLYSISKDCGYIDQNNADSLSKGIIDSLAFTFNLAKKPQDDYGTLLTNAGILGVREGFTIKGEQTVTLEKFLNGEKTDEPVFFAYSNVDNHGKDIAFEDEIMQQWLLIAGLWSVNFSVGIPLGAFIPKGLSGIIAAGRCISVDHNISPCVRMKRDMEKSGEIAATAAYLAISENIAIKEVKYEKLIKLLAKTGCYDKLNDVGFINRAKGGRLEKVKWPKTVDEAINMLRGDNAGLGIWSSKRFGGEGIERLKELLQSKDLLAKKNAAIALGLNGVADGLPLIRSMAAMRDGHIPQTSIKYAYTHGITAVYLLGYLKDIQGLPVLFDIIGSGGMFDTESFVPDELFFKEDDARFMYVSVALYALKKIVDKFPSFKNAVSQKITETLIKPDTRFYIWLKANKYVPHEMTNKLREFIDKNFVLNNQITVLTEQSKTKMVK